MAAPVIAESTKHAFGSNATSYTITGTTLPDFAAGDLCLIFCSTDGAGNALTAHFAAGGGDQALTVIGYSGGNTPSSTWFYRWCTGVELDVDVHILGTNSETCEAIAMRITGVTREFPLIIPVPAIATSQNPDPPAVPALKEARDVLFLAAESHDHTDTWASDPTNYATVQHGNSGTGSGDCGGSVAYRAITNTSLTEDPGTFGLSGSEEYVAWTIAVLGDLSPVVAEQNPLAVPSYAYGFGQAGVAQTQSLITGFVPRESCLIEKVTLYMEKSGSPTDDVRVSLRTAYDGANAVSATVDVQAAAWYEVTFASPYAVTAGTAYWIALERTGSLSDADNYRVDGTGTGNDCWTAYKYVVGDTYTELPLASLAFQTRKTTGPPPEVFVNRSRLVSQAVQRAAVW